MPKKTLNNISEIRRYFHTNKDPIYFVSATNFNLLGLDEWVKNFMFFVLPNCRTTNSSRLRTSTTTFCNTRKLSITSRSAAANQSSFS